jgi:thymidylate synthase (FAD)
VFQWLDQLHRLYVYAQLVYEEGLQAGIPKELARLPMPVGRFSRMRASANLRNWLGFMTLRSAPNAQWEIRQYSNAVGKFVEQSFPRTWGLFAEGKEKS